MTLPEDLMARDLLSRKPFDAQSRFPYNNSLK
jgi:hypothetical protein